MTRSGALLCLGRGNRAARLLYNQQQASPGDSSLGSAARMREPPWIASKRRLAGALGGAGDALPASTGHALGLHAHDYVYIDAPGDPSRRG